MGADVVVSVFHLAAQLTGHLRVLDRLPCPSAVFLIDFAVHRQWLHPDNDLYLCLSDEAAQEVRRAVSASVEVTGDMPGLLSAVRVLVDNAAGQTAAQALATECPWVGYRPLPGHGAAGVRHMAALGVSEGAPDDTSLVRAVERLAMDGPHRACLIARGRELFREDPLARVAALAGMSVA